MKAMTHDECMARLLACPALPRGERACALPAEDNAHTIRKTWWRNHVHAVCPGWMYDDLPDADKKWRRLAAPLRRAREERQKWKGIALKMAPLSGVVHRLQCQGAFSLDRDPFDLMPAIDAYAQVDDEGVNGISGGKMREYIRRWLAGESFRTAGTLDHEGDE